MGKIIVATIMGFFAFMVLVSIIAEKTGYADKLIVDKHRVVEIDHCEYVMINCGSNISLAHKGNCKYCKQREEKKDE